MCNRPVGWRGQVVLSLWVTWLLAQPLALLAISGYQYFVSPHKGWCCAHAALHRGESCSAYAKRTIAQRGVLSGAALLLARLDACREAGAIVRAGPASGDCDRACQDGCEKGCSQPCDTAWTDFWGKLQKAAEQQGDDLLRVKEGSFQKGDVVRTAFDNARLRRGQGIGHQMVVQFHSHVRLRIVGDAKPSDSGGDNHTWWPVTGSNYSGWIAQEIIQKLEQDAIPDPIEGAIAWSQNPKRTPSREGGYTYRCLGFVEDAYRYGGGVYVPFRYRCAKDAADSLVPKKLEVGAAPPPRGALVFYSWKGTVEGEYRDWGHVGISLGSGRLIHHTHKLQTEAIGETLAPIEGFAPQYIGWAWSNGRKPVAP